MDPGTLLWDDSVLVVIDEAITDAESGRPRVLVIDGEQGSGRSALLEEVIRRAGRIPTRSTVGRWQVQAPHRGLRDWDVEVQEPGRDLPFDATDALRSRVDAATRSGPLLLTIDNVHWVDPETMQALTGLLERSAGERLLVAVTTGIIAPTELDGWQTFVATSPLVRRIQLTGLSLVQSGTLVERYQPNAPQHLAADLWRRTGGNPLFLTFLLEHHTADDLAHASTLPAPTEFAREIEGGFVRMGDHARRLAQGLAVLGTGWVPLPDAAYVGDVADPAPAAALLVKHFHAFQRSALSGIEVRLRSSMNQAAVLQHVDAPTLLRLHARAAAVVPDEVAELEHLVAATASYDPALSVRLEEAAERMEAAGSHRLAARYLGWAVRVTPRAGDRARLLLDSLYQRVLAGDVAAVKEELPAARHARDAARVALVTARVHVADDDYTAAAAVLRPFAAATGVDPLAAFRINVLLAWSGMKAGESTRQILDSLERAEATGAHDESLAVEATLTAAIAGRREADFSRPMSVNEGATDRTRRMAWRGCGAALQGRPADAVRLLSTVERHFGRGFATLGDGLAIAFLGYAHWLRGERDLADVRFRAAEEGMGQAVRPLTTSLIAIGHLGRGDLDRADVLLGRAHAALRRDPWLEAINLYVMARVTRAVATQDLEERRGLLDDLRTEFGFDVLRPEVSGDLLWAGHAVLLALWAGERKEADRLLGAFSEVPEAGWLADYRSWLVKALQESAGAASDVPSTFPGAAGPALAPAVSGPARSAPAARADAQQRADSLTVALPASHDLSGDAFSALSNRERDVAALLVSGLSYSQIAQRLYVTRSTVGFHLGNIYAKTGTSSRHELAELVRVA